MGSEGHRGGKGVVDWAEGQGVQVGNEGHWGAGAGASPVACHPPLNDVHLCPPRHSRFGGSYIIQGLKSIGDRDVVFHKGLHNVSDPRRGLRAVAQE